MAEKTTDDRRWANIWDKVRNLIDDPAGLDLGPGSRRVVIEGAQKNMALIHDQDDRLRLIAKDGEQVLGLSTPIAFNPPTAAADDWRWLADASGTYEAFARTLLAKKGKCRVVGSVPPAALKKRTVSPQRLVLESRPSVKNIAALHGIPLEAAVEVYRER